MAARKRVRDDRPAAGAAAGEPLKGKAIAAAQADHERRVALIVSVEHDLVPGSVVHVLREGLALCGAGFPRDWPERHYWIAFNDKGAHLANCHPCSLVLQAHAHMNADAVGKAIGIARRGGPALQALGNEMQRREAEASVALDKDPNARTYSLAMCVRCGRRRTAGGELTRTAEGWICSDDPAACARALAALPVVHLEPITNWQSEPDPRVDDCPACGKPLRNDGTGCCAECGADAVERTLLLERIQRGELGATIKHVEQRPGLYLPIASHELRATPDPISNYAPPLHVATTDPPSLMDVARTLDAIDNAGLDDPLPLAVTPAGQAALASPAELQLGKKPDEPIVITTPEQANALLGQPNPASSLLLDAAVDRAAARIEAEVVAPLRAELAAAHVLAASLGERMRVLAPSMRHDANLEEMLRIASLGAGATRTLAFDPGFAHLGALAIDVKPSQMRCVYREKFNTTTDDDTEVRLNAIAQWIDRLVWQLCPHVVVWENVAAVHAGREGMLRRRAQAPERPDEQPKVGQAASSAARRQLEVVGFIRSSALRYGARLQVLMPATARRTMLGKGATRGSTKHDVRNAVERFLGLRGLNLELSDAGALAITGYLKDREAQLKARARPRTKRRSR